MVPCAPRLGGDFGSGVASPCLHVVALDSSLGASARPSGGAQAAAAWRASLPSLAARAVSGRPASARALDAFAAVAAVRRHEHAASTGAVCCALAAAVAALAAAALAATAEAVTAAAEPVSAAVRGM